MFLTSTSLWFLVVYAMRIALFGNPLVRHVMAAPPDLVTAADAATGEAGESDARTAQFIRGFFLRLLLGLAMLALEFALLVRLYLLDILPELAMVLFIRSLVVAAIGSIAANQLDRGKGTFETLLDIPPWMLRLDRANALASGTGAIAFLLAILRS